jgi:outer membrane protein
MNTTIRSITTALCAAGIALASSAHAQSSDTGTGIHAGDTFVRLRAITIMPDTRTSDTLSALNVGVNNATVPELDFTYMVLDNVGVELILATSRHQVTSNLGDLGGVNVLPPTLLLQYHFNHAGRVRPYVGAGVNYTYFYNDGLHAGDQQISVKRSSFGPALQVGVDVQLTKSWFANVDLKKVWMKTDASMDGASLGTLHIDPLIVGVGIGMKF